jgi:hypothetical protein
VPSTLILKNIYLGFKVFLRRLFRKMCQFLGP